MRWLVATVAATIPETPVGVSLRMDVPEWPGHRAGQHVDIRLTAEDGYSAQRSYSIASAPGAERVELTVIRIDDGEVSPFLTTVVEVGDQLEIRGPIGGYFVWEPVDARPVLLVGGGSGVVPLMAMLRHHAALDHNAPMHLIYSVRARADILYHHELGQLATRPRSVIITLTREAPADWSGHVGRVDRELLSQYGWPPQERPICYVCGPTPFVEAVADGLVDLGHDPANVRTERFGPTGGG
jgi:ferredoxin-NADP reductase